MTKLISPGTPVPSIQRIDGCSHSGMIGGYFGGSDNSYFKKVAKVLGARKMGWLSAGGSCACWPTANAGTDGGYSWVNNMFQVPGIPSGDGSYQPHTNVAIVHHGAEDGFVLGSQNLKAFEEALKTEISRYCSAYLHEAEADTTLAMPAPAVSTGGTGGTLAVGTWYYKVVAYNAIGESTAAQASATITAGQKVTLTWAPLFGATGYRVMRSGPNVVSFAGRIEVGNVTTFVDDGTQAPVGSTDSPATGTNMHWSFGSAMQTVSPGSNWSASGGGSKFIQVPVGGPNPATMWAQYQTDTDYPGNLVVAIGMDVIPGPVGGGNTVTLGVIVDGVAKPDYVVNYDKGGHADAENGKQNGIVLRLGRSDCGLGLPLTAGVHTIRITVKSVTGGGGSGQYVVWDYAQIEADPLDGPIVVLPSGFWRLPSYAGKFTVSQGWAHGSDAATDPLGDNTVAAIIASQKRVMADFPGRCIYVDLDGLINKNASGGMLWQDGVHPSNQGHARIASAVHQAILNSGLLTTRLVNAPGQRQLGPFDGGVWRTIGGVYGTGSNQRPFTNSWVASSSTSTFPAYMLGQLDGRMRLRGLVKQGGAGAANSVHWGADEGSCPNPSQTPVDVTVQAYGGSGNLFTIPLRQDTNPASNPPRACYSVTGAPTAAGSFIEYNGAEWSAEA